MAVNLGAAYVALKGDMGPLKLDLRTAKRLVKSSVASIAKTASRGITGAIKGIGGAITAIGRSLFSLRNIAIAAFVGWGIKKVSGIFIEAASTSEQFRVRLTALLGNVKEGNELFRKMSEFAAEVPFQYQHIMEAATSLAGVMKGGVSEIEEWMPLIADLAAVTGMTLQETTGQVIRMYSAGAASADMFRERGILAMLGFQAGVKYTAEETRRIMMESWKKTGSQFKDATKKLAKTWKGLMSMFGDLWFSFRNVIMDAGVFDLIKTGFRWILDELRDLMPLVKERLVPAIQELVDKVRSWFKVNEEIIKQKMADYWKTLQTRIEKTWKWIKILYDFISDKVTPVFKDLAEWIDLIWFRMKIWYLMNEDFIKQKMAEVFDKIAGAAKIVWKRIEEILEWIKKLAINTDWESWAKGVKESIEIIARGFKNAIPILSAVNKAIQFSFGLIEKWIDKWKENPDAFSPEFVVDFEGTGSTTEPLTEKIDEIMNDFEGMTDLMETPIVATADMTGVTLEIAAVSQLASSYVTEMASLLDIRERMLAPGSIVVRLGGLAGLDRDIAALIRRWESLSSGSFQHGTGREGLPHTGMFFGHKGEIVKNPQESDTERRGAGSGDINITVAPTFMTGDRTAARSAAIEIKRELDNLGLRWGSA